MSQLPRRYWQEMTTEEITALDRERTIALLPIAAIEQHGPHLPVYVDACINQGLITRTLELMPDDLPVTVLPPITVGKSNEHAAFPGTLTLSAETLIRVLMEMGECVHRSGLGKLVLYNSHGGQPQILDIVARDLRVRFKLLVVAATAYNLADGDDLFSEWELRHGIHGGDIETSIMLALRPDLVRMEKTKRFDPVSTDMEKQFRFLMPEGRVGFGWQIQDIQGEGTCGDAGHASAEKGQKMIDRLAEGLVTLLREVDQLPLTILKDHPESGVLPADRFPGRT